MFTHRRLMWRGTPGLLWITLFCATPTVADDCRGDKACKIAVTFKGIYLENTCEVSIDSGGSENTVTLPTISTTKLRQEGDESGSRQFQITLKSCPAGKTVNLRFVSAGLLPDSDTGNLVNMPGAGMSRGVQVRLRTSAGVQLYVDNMNSFQQYIIPPDGDEVTHYYLATYYAKGTGRVTPGEIRTLTGIELTYK